MNATHTLEDEFRTPDRVRGHVLVRILGGGHALVEDLQDQGQPSEVLEDLLLEDLLLEDLLLDLQASGRDHLSFESW